MTYLNFILGVIIGVLGTLVFVFKRVDAILAVNRSDPDKDKYKFVILCPLDKLPEKKYMVVQVKEIK